MVEKKVLLKNEEGLHGRAAASFVREANKFESGIKIQSGDVAVNGKSIIGIMSLGAFSGEELIIKADGEDEEEALDALIEHVKNNFEM